MDDNIPAPPDPERALPAGEPQKQLRAPGAYDAAAPTPPRHRSSRWWLLLPLVLLAALVAYLIWPKSQTTSASAKAPSEKGGKAGKGGRGGGGPANVVA